jgi:subtilisin family serine protease
MNTSLENLVAYVSVRSIGGVSVFSGKTLIRHDTVQQFTSHPLDTRRAIGKLDELGFKIDRVSPISVRLTGPAKLFRKHFGLQFEKRDSPMYVPTAGTEANCLNLGSEVFEGLAFPQPLALHGQKKAAKKKRAKKSVKKAATAAGALSTTPPALSYHHLQVPGDIVTALNAGPVHASGNQGQSVRAAMIDSGFHWSHPYFSGKGYDLEVALPAGSDADANGHGTGESANFLAIAPKTKLYGLSMDDAVLAFQTARDQLGVKIVTNSWGSDVDTDGPMSTWDPFWSLLLGEIALCVAAGMVVLFSGGNGQMSATASSPDTISVGGVYRDEYGALQASDYASSFDSFRFPGQHVPEVCGLCGMKPRAIYIALPIPSGCVIDKSYGGSAFPQRDETTKSDGWGVFSGTSAACPMVAGVVALILSQHPSADLAEIRQRLARAIDVVQGASFMGDAAGPGFDPATGYGLVDAAQACS